MCISTKKNLMMTKKSYLYDRFFVSNWIFTTQNVKIVGNSRFLSKFLKFKVFFCLYCQIPFFSRFPGKTATLCKIKNKWSTLIQKKVTRKLLDSTNKNCHMDLEIWVYWKLKKYFGLKIHTGTDLKVHKKTSWSLSCISDQLKIRIILNNIHFV